MSSTISHHQALIYLMVLVSASDAEMTNRELQTIGDVVMKFPVFRDFDPEKLVGVAEEAGEILSSDGGLQAVLGLAKEAIPESLVETAYAAALEVAAADDRIQQEELRVLDLMRHTLKVDRLAAAAMERSAQARHRRI